MKKTTLTVVLFTSLLTIMHLNCRKSDLRLDTERIPQNEAFVINNFFQTSQNTEPVVQKIAEELKRRELQNNFIYDFAVNYGFPVWHKSIISLPSKKNKISSSNSIGNNETLVYIPIVLQDSAKSNGFIRAVINDSICLSYCLARDYKNYPFSQQTGATTANEFASLFMIFDKNIYGTNEFKITDNRLLTETWPSNNSNKTRQAKILNVTNGIPSGGNLCEGSIYTVSWLVQDAENCTCANGASNGGVCLDWHTGCQACSNTISITINVGSGDCGGGSSGGPVGGGTPVSGGPSGGGSGNGGGQIPPYYPCTGSVPTSLLPEPLPPCPPPGGGVGWIPLPAIPFFGIESVTSNFTNPCIVAAKNKLPEFNLNIFANSLYLAPISQTFNWKIIFEEDRNLVYQDGSPKPAESFAVTPNKEWHVVLNPLFWEQPTQPNATQEIAGLNILHEIVHGFIRVYKDYFNLTNLNSFNTHEIMFKDCVNAMALVLKNSFGLSENDAMGLALQGLDDVLEKEYSAAGTLSAYNLLYNQFAISNYGISIPQAEDVFEQFLSGTKGTRCF